jgi:phosphoketolase
MQPPTDARPRTLQPSRILELIDAYWRAANYLSVGQIYSARQSAAA